ncbi:MAG: type II toxin-antitoxin system Phd/YefM family antitoxin [Xenococcaceae cyanobacterium]
MKTYTLTETRNRHGEVFDKATVEPVLVTKQQRPSHVIMSAESYQHLIARLEELEDLRLGKMVEAELSQSEMVGIEKFTATLKQLANG